jgi:hypothetical protein
MDYILAYDSVLFPDDLWSGIYLEREAEHNFNGLPTYYCFEKQTYIWNLTSNSRWNITDGVNNLSPGLPRLRATEIGSIPELTWDYAVGPGSQDADVASVEEYIIDIQEESFPLEEEEYLEYLSLPIGKGGKCYYTHNRPGTPWYDYVDHTKGWTVDFNLKTVVTENTDYFLAEDSEDGVGIYVNDGVRKETIMFLEQEIVFVNAKHSLRFDTTREKDYRLISKGDSLELFAQAYGEQEYTSISKVSFLTPSTNQGNGYKPSMCGDSRGYLHAVWHDDGNGTGQIYYSMYTGAAWTAPELIVDDENGSLYPDIAVDNDGVIYVVYETGSSDYTAIGFLYKTRLGWANSYKIGVSDGDSKKPKISITNQYEKESQVIGGSIVIVWEDYRNIYPEIYLNQFILQTRSWVGEKRITDSDSGSHSPSITSYMDDIFIAFIKKESLDRNRIGIMKYNSNSYNTTSTFIVTDYGFMRYVDILSNVSGKICLAWHDNSSGKYEIYSTVLSPSFGQISDTSQISASRGGAKFPVIAEQQRTGNIYIVWQDYASGDYTEFDEYCGNYSDDPYDDGDPSNIPSVSVNKQVEPIDDQALYVSSYSNLGDIFTAHQYVIQLSFNDNRKTLFPSVPPSFLGEMPIVYESSMSRIGSFLEISDLFEQIRCAFYNLSLENNPFLVSHGSVSTTTVQVGNVEDPSVDPYIDLLTTNGDRDLIISERETRKEIRFGDFSSVIRVKYSFKNFMYYLEDSVIPYKLTEVISQHLPVDRLASLDSSVNNYGDAWIVGPTGTYLYINRSGSIVQVGIGDDYSIQGPNGSTGAIAFDSRNTLFVSAIGSINYSKGHIDGFSSLSGVSVSGSITVMAFDSDGLLFIGTDADLFVYQTVYESSGTITASPFATEVAITGYISSIEIDNAGVAWIGTHNGLFRYFKQKSLRFDTKNGMPSSRVNDIAIRNTAIRYIATSNGIIKMIGINFDSNLINVENSNLWNNNVKSIEWEDPNILWAGTLSKINQIMIVDDDEGGDGNNNISQEYDVTTSNFYQGEDLSLFYITYSPEETSGEKYISTDSSIKDKVIDVYINGNLIKYGYVIGFDYETNQNVIKFETNLLRDDVVTISVRNDIEIIKSFVQSPEEKAINNSTVITKQLESYNENIYILASNSQGDNVKVNDGENYLPFDRIHLDTAPPTGSITIDEQIDKSIVKVDIDATDGENGSGVKSMIVSNYPNFTTDGTTLQDAIDFRTSINHDLGLSLENVTTPITFSTGNGSRISIFTETGEKFVGVSNPAILYKYNTISGTWDSLFSYEDGNGEYIDFIAYYNGKLVVSVGKESGDSQIYSYSYIYDNQSVFVNYSEPDIFGFTEPRANCFSISNSKMYIGTGDGPSPASSVTNGGALYIYDGLTVTKMIDSIDDNISGITPVPGTTNINLVTGNTGYVYEVDVSVYEETGSAIGFITYNALGSLSSISYINIGNKDLIFIGSGDRGDIRRSLVDKISYDISFTTTGSSVSVLKTIVDNQGESSLYAAIGNVLYYLPTNGVWIWKYTHSEDINDVDYDLSDGSIYIISNSSVINIGSLLESKSVYLKLIDFAGNETSLYVPTTIDDEGNTITDPDFVSLDTNEDGINDSLMDTIAISNLKEFINENKIFEIDDAGNILFNLRGHSPFYSGARIEEEKGVYESEIFNGTNDLVKWDLFSWNATELSNTEVLTYIRSASSEDEILTTDWIGPFYNNQSSGIDISYLNQTNYSGVSGGQFIQFKVELISESKDLSPIFHNAFIRAVTSEAVHFFTTNFVLPSSVRKGILTSEKIVPVSADIIFGINTTNSIDWGDYQIIDENRIFNINKLGNNVRVGIQLISPNRTVYTPSTFGEYGPYNYTLFTNTIESSFTNVTGSDDLFHFKVKFYDSAAYDHLVYEAYSYESSDGFNVDGVEVESQGVSISNGNSVRVSYNAAAASIIECNKYYWIRIESNIDFDNDSAFSLVLTEYSFIMGCSSSFVDIVEFRFRNTDASSRTYHFRNRFYVNPERTIHYLTEYSGNDVSGWFVDEAQISENGHTFASEEISNILYRPDLDEFEVETTYYLIIDAYDTVTGEYILSSDSYTFQVRDPETSSESCGGYVDIPIVKNFAVMFEMEDNSFATLNI